MTSDIFDLERVGWETGVKDWRERLVGGIAIHGRSYPGAEPLARFLVRAAELCQIKDRMQWAGYLPQSGDRFRYLQPASLRRVARGTLRAASEGITVILGGREAGPSIRDSFVIGGSAEASHDATFSADFIFPLNVGDAASPEELLSQAAEITGADYGYYFVRDALCFPDYYPWGFGAPVDGSWLARDDSTEIADWRQFVITGGLWTDPWPQLRDLFEVNLLSERHLVVPTERLGYLGDWINAETGRGRLQEVRDGRVLWTLTDAEIHGVRPTLHQAGLLRSCRSRYYRDLSIAQERPDRGPTR